MALFTEVFNKASIYDMLFFNVKGVLIYPSLEVLKNDNPILYERWKYLSKSKYNCEIRIEDNNELLFDVLSENTYQEKAIYFPEFSRIIAITYMFVLFENGELKRTFKKIVNEDEYIVIATFMDVLHQLSSDGMQSKPQSFPMLTGHNIINYDIPLLIKRFLIQREKFTNKQLPLILKNSLNAKPWESVLIDTINVWNFNGIEYAPLMLISDYMNLKKTVDLLTLPEVSKYYWENVNENPKETLDHIQLQSATQTNLVFQLINELRNL